ncbi:glutathione S-transferase family protein [Microvirga rosea]|uniref:glutathione S-transferase family protein n=1 Tax=Microvirga rosea TaxID=2715425 RepID=UPI001D0B6446|nr:glutathione S-transferase N-terminal domain-containing protein [Microvirga rosea]MCB8823394.1 glutathione S-transferase N-terminal domain-containing protein [Microvirga rosea]
MYTLYYSPGACSMAPHIVLEEIGKPFHAEHTSAFGGKVTNTDAFARINPKRRVPVLHPVEGRMGGAPDALTEANAILLYLARTNPELNMLPQDPAREARCIEWLNWLSSAVHAISYGQLWRPQRYVGDERDFPAVVAKGHINVREQYAYIEDLLADGRRWAEPGGYSIVDPFLLVLYHWGERIELAMTRDYPAWTDLSRRLLDRPAVQRVLAREGISILASNA